MSSDIAAEYIRVRAQRLEKAKEVKALEEREKELKQLCIQAFRAKNFSLLGSGASRLSLNGPKNKPTVTDWDLVWGYIVKHKAFDLVQKRLTESAVEARWEDNIIIPGVSTFPVWDISVSK